MTGIPHDYLERCYAGWLGKVIGVRHGAPIEGWDYHRIGKVLGEIDGYLVDYRDFAADDDTNGPLFFLRALSDYTPTRALTAEQIGLTWLNYAPYEHGFYWWGGYGRSTEHTAYLNLRAGIAAPDSGSVAQNGAAVAEQIGGQIFIDSWGLVAPGNPELAAEYAAKAASVSHGGNGVYGGQFVAAAISAAFVERDIRRVLERALALIPEDCEYARMTRDIFAFFDGHEADGWRTCMEHILNHWGYDRYPGVCHIIPNSAVMVMSMLYGQGDFSRTINICNMAGWDTDCNVGNVGAILGVLVGLDGIEDRWRQPINDFLAASSVVGCLNIMDLPGCVRQIANLAYQVQPGEPPLHYREFLEGRYRFDFALPGSTCAFRAEGAGATHLFHEREVFESGQGALRVVMNGAVPGEDRLVYHRTYYRPRHFHDSRYDPSFSPILYPGQTVKLRLRAEPGARLRAAAYALDGNGERRYEGAEAELRPGEWTTLEVTVPPLSGACIEQAGVRFTPLMGCTWQPVVYIDWMNFEGKADYTLDMAAERMEVWKSGRREPSQMTYLKGIWDREGDALMGSCADYGEAYTGDIRWRDVEVTCCWTPRLGRGCTGFGLRVQGAVRGYAVWLDGEQLTLAKNENGYRTLASCPYRVQPGARVALTARAVGNVLTVCEGDRELLRAIDLEQPYESGMAALVLREGGHAHFHSLAVRAL